MSISKTTLLRRRSNRWLNESLELLRPLVRILNSARNGELVEVVDRLGARKLGIILATLRLAAEVECYCRNSGFRKVTKEACKDSGVSFPAGTLAVAFLGAWLRGGGSLENTGIPLPQAEMLKNDPPLLNLENVEDDRPADPWQEAVLRHAKYSLHSQAYRLACEWPTLANKALALAAECERERRQFLDPAGSQVTDFPSEMGVIRTAAPARLMWELARCPIIIPSRARPILLKVTRVTAELLTVGARLKPPEPVL